MLESIAQYTGEREYGQMGISDHSAIPHISRRASLRAP